MSHGTTELDRPVPLYMQVARQLRAQIAAGELHDGDRLPSQREMMARWRISMQTASKVIGAMKTEGLAVPSVGRDTIVAPGAAARIAAAAQRHRPRPRRQPPARARRRGHRRHHGEDSRARPGRRDPGHPRRPPRPAPHRDPRRQRTARQPHRLLVPPGHRRRRAPPGRQPAAARRNPGLHRRSHRDPRSPRRRGPRRRARRRRHRRRTRHQPRLTGPHHPRPVLRRRRQAHRVRRNHHARRAPLRPQLHHHRQLTAATICQHAHWAPPPHSRCRPDTRHSVPLGARLPRLASRMVTAGDMARYPPSFCTREE